MPTTITATLAIGILLPFTESAVNNELGVAQQRAAELYLQQRGGKLAGRTVKLVYSDEAISGPLDATKASELIEKEHAELLLGIVGNDGAYAVRSYVDGKKVVFVDTHASGNALTRALVDCQPSCKSRYVFRSSFSNWQLSEPLGAWAAKNGHTAFFLCHADDAFGSESAAAFVEGLTKGGGRDTGRTTVPSGSDREAVVRAIRGQATKNVFAAFAGVDAATFIETWVKAKLSDAGYKLFGPGPLLDGDVLKSFAGATVGTTTTHFWADTLDNPENRALTERFPKTYADEEGRPVPVDMYVVEMWDAMKGIEEALKKTNGSTASDLLIAALEGVSFKSPRGDFTFDKSTHNVIQNIYVREVRVVDGTAANVVVDTIANVADPGR